MASTLLSVSVIGAAIVGMGAATAVVLRTTGPLAAGDTAPAAQVSATPVGEPTPTPTPPPAEAQGVVSTVAGLRRLDPNVLEWTDGPVDQAKLGYPEGIAVGPDGSIYIADFYGRRIRQIDPAGNVRTIAGNGEEATKDGPGPSASFEGPNGIAVGRDGSLFVTDGVANRIRRIDSAGNVTTFAGGGPSGLGQGSLADGNGQEARFKLPAGIVFDTDGSLVVADKDNSAIRRITPSGDVTTITREISEPVGVAVDFSSGTIDVTSHGGRSGGVFKIDRQGVVTDMKLYVGFVSFLAVRPGTGELLVSLRDNSRILLVSPSGQTSLLTGASGPGFRDGPTQIAQFDGPSGLAFDAQGALLVADPGNGLIRRIVIH